MYLPIKQWERAFWSPNGGVGSNPTPDILFFFSFFSLANYVFYLLSCCINDVVRFYLKLDSEIAIQSSLKGIIKTLRPRREMALLK